MDGGREGGREGGSGKGGKGGKGVSPLVAGSGSRLEAWPYRSPTVVTSVCTVVARSSIEAEGHIGSRPCRKCSAIGERFKGAFPDAELT